MNFITIENNTKINTKEIPTVTIDEIKEFYKNSKNRVLNFFGTKENENTRLYVLFANDKKGIIYITSVLFSSEIKEYESFTQNFPAFHNFEREFYEEFGIKPINHPWLKPLRKNQDQYEFFKMKGEDIHEVAVGPIHAGVIEPGHFRFMCQGEKVYELEIMLGYQNRGVENLLTENKYNNPLAESICGDTVIGHNMAYSQLMEELSNTKVTDKAQIIRRIALELERIAIHIGDMGAISGDIAYLPGASIFGVTRTLVINTMLEISGSRFGRGLIEVGGVNFDINDEMSIKILNMLEEVSITVDKITKVMNKKPSCLSRMEKTGVITKEQALEIGAVGMAARCTGLMLDSRIDFRDKFYNLENLRFNASGDVFSRFNLRYLEVKQSILAVKDLLEILKLHKDETLKVNTLNLIPNSFGISITEGWRGEIVHIALTDENGKIYRYKIKDASFNNWYMLALAVRNNGISDFPLCNKSFNLSYCGNDL